nr:demethylmenaquinone methyltransferase [Zhihengliuella flava]
MQKRPEEVQAMFDDVAPRYDIVNDILSLGQDRRWRKVVVDAVGAQPGESVLDLAAGTGTSSEPYADAGIHVVACDFSAGMLEVGRRRRPDIEFVEGDATNLPFEDATFDAVTISFGLRNVSDPHRALREMARVTKPGGRLVVCEFSHPSNSVFRTVYTEYLMKALPPIARKVSSNPESYVYLAESIRAWPAQNELAGWINTANWQDCRYRNLTGGIVAVHHAVKPHDGAGSTTEELTDAASPNALPESGPQRARAASEYLRRHASRRPH